MQTRKFGDIFDASVLGFGAMRLPQSGGAVDEREAIRMLRYAVDNNVNYIDTAYFYHDGKSEEIVGRALLDGYRNKTKLATKLPLFDEVMQSPEDYDKLLDTQLKRLRTDHIDFYLFHAVDEKRWDNLILKFDLLDKMERAKKQGKIGHIGFSFHDGYSTFERVVDGYDKWEFCQVQYNYMNVDFQAGEKGIRYASAKGIPVVVMEPVFGGKLAEAPRSVQALFDGHPVRRAPVEWALRFVWNRPEVPVLLSGMSSMEQLGENLKYAQNAQAGVLTNEDMALLDRVREEYQRLRPVPCTACGYCRPCPQGVNIPANLDIYNDTFSFSPETVKGGYLWMGDAKAEFCVGCGECDSKCPQGISIASLMPKIHERLS